MGGASSKKKYAAAEAVKSNSPGTPKSPGLKRQGSAGAESDRKVSISQAGGVGRFTSSREMKDANIEFCENLRRITEYDGSLSSAKTKHQYRKCKTVHEVQEQALPDLNIVEKGEVAIMYDYFEWKDVEYVLCKQQKAYILYLPSNFKDGAPPASVKSYEVIYGKPKKWRNSQSASFIRKVKEKSPACHEALKIPEALEGRQFYRLYHRTGSIYLSVPSSSPTPCPPHHLFAAIDKHVPSIHAKIDIMGESSLQKVEKSISAVEEPLLMELLNVHKLWSNSKVDERTIEKAADKGGDDMIYSATVRTYKDDRTFADAFVIIYPDVLCTYDTRQGYLDNIAPTKIMSIREVMLSGQVRDKNVLIVQTAIYQMRFEVNEHDELKDLASKVGEACSGHNNVPEIFMLVERAKLAKERKERNSLTEESDKLSDSGRFEYDGADSRLST
ncbi:hypothetical protein TL16_g00624 [Triparma laevis f. inornata]|uniref:Uncharacterized protein n=2 Tax=Triparma laevis TaxID=1534972 RepID=A0A9W7KY91_9STRA|nr:hypothetical protein TL16_g00624 [Triparma laevis f. inornata]GMI16262.1 hypothetical protein TrLO_g11919 [Triparma laevis f. longispina]